MQVTHKDITRFFMTIPEACQLVMEAGSMGEGGEIYLFDMCKPVKIMIGRVRYYDFDIESRKISELLSHLTKDTEEMLVARMKDIVPEYTSMNSRFEVLDQKMEVV